MASQDPTQDPTALAREIPSAMTPQQLAMLHQGLLPGASTLLHAPDMDWVAAITAQNFDFLAVPPEADYVAMRRWGATEFAKYDHVPKARRLRPEVLVVVRDEKVEYGAGEGFRMRVYKPELDGEEGEVLRPALIMYHGGAWSHGSPEVDEDLAIFLASELRATVFAPAYRLAPEHPITTLHADCHEALAFVLRSASAYNVDPARVALWGSSAGAHLAAGVAMRDAREHTPSRLCMVCLNVPVTCHLDAFEGVLKEVFEVRREEYRRALAGSPISVEVMEGMFRTIIGYLTASSPTPLPPTHPLLSPLLHPRPWPAHHAPTHITVAGCDPLADQGVAYAMALRDAGVEDVTLEVVPGVPHGFSLAVESKAAKAWVRGQVRVLGEGFRKGVRGREGA